MRIGIVTTWFERGAAYVSKLYKELLEEEHDVFVYARGGEEYAIGDPNWDHSYVHWGKRYEMPTHHTYVDSKDFREWVTRNNLEVVLFNEQRWWQPIKICRELGVKTGAYIDYYTDNTLKLFNSYDFLICNTKRHHLAMEGHKQSFYVPWGTDVELFKPIEDKKRKNADLVFFHSAGMSPFRKGTDFVIKAFNKICEKYPTGVKLIIHTQIDINSFFPELIDVINELIKNGHLEVIEKTVSAPGLYHLGDVYVYPSRIEGIGLTIAEAIASGLPTVTVDNGPMNEFICWPSQAAKVKKYYSRSDGYYWPVCEVDVDDFVNKLEFFVKKKMDLEKFKVETRDYAIKNLNWENNKSEVNRIFKEARILKCDDELIRQLDLADTGKYPLLNKYPKLYSFFYKLFKYLMKATSR